LADDFVQEHRRSLLDIVTAGMEERIHCEVRTTLQVVGMAAPRDFLSTLHSPLSTFSGVETDTHRSLLLKRMQVSFEAFIAY
jgi:hypothetical protein